MNSFGRYEVIVVGGGHAGCEAALAAANMGKSVLLLTMNLATIGQMSCNPAMGGVAKGQIIREIDALGGFSGKITDQTTIQFRMLNRSKGPAMWSPRAQNDRVQFALAWRELLESHPRIGFFQDTVSSLLIQGKNVLGVRTNSGISFEAKTVILTTGTFLNGKIHVGETHYSGGRTGEKSSTGITEQLRYLGFSAGRMKTGTPPRVDGRSLDYSKMEEQKGDPLPSQFSFWYKAPSMPQMSCYITYTNPEVHECLRTGFDRSPMFTGSIKGLGPRYCPSIEDKINRFSDRDRHQIFVEPEGPRTHEVYVNGFSTSLPLEVQNEALKKVLGFEKVKMLRPGYAIEYDFFHPTQLKLSLETKVIEGLFLAGQINGTTGYEEAAGQGLMAGINAALRVEEKEPFVLTRGEAYIGVLIDDLVTKGTDEPYRMFTSRAEHRLLLRQDNADIRLSEYGRKHGLLSEEQITSVRNKKKKTNELISVLRHESVNPLDVNLYLTQQGTTPLTQSIKASTLLARPQVRLEELIRYVARLAIDENTFDPATIEQAEIEIKYEHYFAKERETIERLKAMDSKAINPAFSYQALTSLSKEAREKLGKVKPQTLGQASRISGVSPADISILLTNLSK